MSNRLKNSLSKLIEKFEIVTRSWEKKSIVTKYYFKIEELEADSRPYADIIIFGNIIRGLMDSGASICVLG